MGTADVTMSLAAQSGSLVRIFTGGTTSEDGEIARKLILPEQFAARPLRVLGGALMGWGIKTQANLSGTGALFGAEKADGSWYWVRLGNEFVTSYKAASNAVVGSYFSGGRILPADAIIRVYSPELDTHSSPGCGLTIVLEVAIND